MPSLYEGGLWCPECRSEYRPGFIECTDCRVSLVAERPPLHARGRDERDHRVVEYDLGEWTDDQRAALDLLLVGRELPHDWEGDHLVAAHVHEAEVDALVDEIDAEPPPGVVVGEGAGALATDDDRDPFDDVIAGAGRRLLGYVVDVVVFGSIIASTRATLGVHDASGMAVLAAAMTAFYEIVPVALSGRTVGKVVVGTRIVREADHILPGWRQATIRWAVPAAPGLLGLVLTGGLFGLACLASMIVVYAGVLLDKRGRGLHDKAAGTVVVLV